MKFLILIQGGEGPDVWDKELIIIAINWHDAVDIAEGRADYFGGQVVNISLSV